MLLLKIIGCILVVCVSVYVGASYAKSLKNRINSLSKFIELLTIFMIKIEYELCDIPLMLREISEQEEGIIKEILESCIIEINSGTSLKGSWNKSIDKYSCEMCLSKDDENIIKDFSNSLGDTDVKGQISNIKMYIELLNKKLKKAEKEAAEKSRVSMSCSLFLGLLISILLI